MLQDYYAPPAELMSLLFTVVVGLSEERRMKHPKLPLICACNHQSAKPLLRQVTFGLPVEMLCAHALSPGMAYGMLEKWIKIFIPTVLGHSLLWRARLCDIRDWSTYLVFQLPIQ